MAVNQHVNKVILNGTTLMDVSDNTITDEDMMEGVTATMPDGSTKTGKMRLDDIEDLLSGISTAIEGISGGGSPAGIRLANVSDTSITGVFRTGITVTWMDPDDAVTDPSDTGGAATLAEWAGTKLVRKPNSAPLSPTDGVVITDNKIRGQYAVNGYLDDSVDEYGVTYYYRFFPYTIDGVYTTGSYVSYAWNAPSWVSSSDADVITAIQAADNGELDLYEDLGWRVGDIRPIIFGNTNSSTIAGLALVNKGSNFRILETPRTKKDGTTTTEPNFVVALGKFYSPYYNNSVFPNVSVTMDRAALVQSIVKKVTVGNSNENEFYNYISSNTNVYVNGLGSYKDVINTDNSTANGGIPYIMNAVSKKHKPKHMSVLYTYYNGSYFYTTLRLVNPNNIKFPTSSVMTSDVSYANKYSFPSALELGQPLPTVAEMSADQSSGGFYRSSAYANGSSFLVTDTGFGESEHDALNSHISDYKWSFVNDKNPYTMCGYFAASNIAWGNQIADTSKAWYTSIPLIDILTLRHRNQKGTSGSSYKTYTVGIGFQEIEYRRAANASNSAMAYYKDLNYVSGYSVRYITRSNISSSVTITANSFSEGGTGVSESYYNDSSVDGCPLVFCI